MSQRPYTVEQLRQRLGEVASMYAESDYTPTPKELNYTRGQVAAGIDQIIGDVFRHDALYLLMGKYSTKDITVSQLRALHLWLYPDSGGGVDPAPYQSKKEGGVGYGVTENAVTELLAVKAAMIDTMFKE